MSKSHPIPTQVWARGRSLKPSQPLHFPSSTYFALNCWKGDKPQFLQGPTCSIPLTTVWAERHTSEPAFDCAQEQGNTLHSLELASLPLGPWVMILLGTLTFANNLMAVSAHWKTEWCFAGVCVCARRGAGKAHRYCLRCGCCCVGGGAQI